jgi:pimeloyl-ACP methyl ester carboxylesterase
MNFGKRGSARRVAAGLVAAAVAVVVGAAVNPAPAAAVPTLAWTDCGGGYQCTSVGVPLDYDQPRGAQLALAAIKLPASDPTKRIGTLFVNFGGPGASGVDRLRLRSGWDWLFSPELKERFDLVAWDTRGVYHSTTQRCFDTDAEQADFFNRQPTFPVGAVEERAFYADAAELGVRCLVKEGDLINHMSSANTARDLDVMRQAVGDRQLSYLGLSYGTYVGATYANLFPTKVRAMVLDGALDFTGNATGHGTDGLRLPIDTRQDVPRGIAETVGQFVSRCDAAGAGCALSGGAAAKFATLAQAARQAPISLYGSDWTYAGIIGTIAGNLVHPLWWADLAVLLQDLYNAATGAPAALTARRALVTPEQYDNRSEAFYATNCVDSVVPRNPSVYSRLAVTEDRRVPYFGPVGVFDYMPCAFWPGHDADRYDGPWNTWTSAPILVVNNRYDPSTPLHGAQDGTAELARGYLFTVEGAGHTGMYVPSTCGEKVKRDYLFTATLPAPTVTCSADDNPFPS